MTMSEKRSSGNEDTMTVDLALTALEARTLEMAAASIAEDIDSYGLSAAEKAAYTRALGKLRAKLRAKMTVAPWESSPQGGVESSYDKP